MSERKKQVFERKVIYTLNTLFLSRFDILSQLFLFVNSFSKVFIEAEKQNPFPTPRNAAVPGCLLKQMVGFTSMQYNYLWDYPWLIVYFLPFLTYVFRSM